MLTAEAKFGVDRGGDQFVFRGAGKEMIVHIFSISRPCRLNLVALAKLNLSRSKACTATVDLRTTDPIEYPVHLYGSSLEARDNVGKKLNRHIVRTGAETGKDQSYTSYIQRSVT